ncbi:hypothetical protein COHA_008498 [Chlorella ohadii]|uniref:Uncharacterized protein n=1 Tax=Chlorella ohadii TaxID=2649997 RepID=A0AAD5DLC0_9CHLO|nr:hypothetical protein COHA_008498 [Chlorella ohadii]
MPPGGGRAAGGGGRGAAGAPGGAPGGRGAAGSADKPRVGFRGTAENAKTRICQRWEAGHCRFGDRCNFAHGDEELRSLPPRGGGRGRGGRGGGEGGYREEGGRGGGRGQGYGGRGGSVANGRTRERDDVAWKAAGCPVPGPAGWTQYRTEGGEAYYHNSKTQETTWDPPEAWKNPPQVN